MEGFFLLFVCLLVCGVFFLGFVCSFLGFSYCFRIFTILFEKMNLSFNFVTFFSCSYFSFEFQQLFFMVCFQRFAFY